MTTHVPHGSDHVLAEPQPKAQPAPTYPTSPPWAASPPAVAVEMTVPAYGTVAPYGSPMREYGQLLVRYPEEMQHAARTKAPAWWPVVLFTLVFGVGGLISAVRRSAQARRGRNDRAPYWIAFAVSFVVSVGLVVMVTPIAVPVYLNAREGALTKVVQERIVKDGRLRDTSRVTATSARCEPAGDRGADGVRRYSCLLKLDGGGTGTLDVTADSDGNWTAVPLRK